MTIAVLVSGLPPDRIGGAERQASQLAARLAARHSVRILTRTATVPDHLARLPGCVVTQRSKVGVPGVRFAADIVETLVRIATIRGEIDVILAYQTMIDGFIAVLAKLAFGIPVVVSVRCDTEYQLDRFRQSRLFSPFVFRHADRLGVQSAALGEALVRALRNAGRWPTEAELRAKLFVLPNAIAPSTPRQGVGDGVLFVGRLTRAKGVDVLIEAMAHCPDQRLTIVGDGPERRALEEAARRLSNVAFTGSLAHAEVAEHLARARLLVLPSRQEGVPNVLMEAMSLGVPVIATRVGGVPDLVAHGITGWLVEPDDAPALVCAIRTITADGGLRERLAANGLKAVRRYDWGTTLDACERTLLEVAAEKR